MARINSRGAHITYTTIAAGFVYVAATIDACCGRTCDQPLDCCAAGRCCGRMPSEMKRLRQLEEDPGQLKQIVAELSLDKEGRQPLSDRMS